MYRNSAGLIFSPSDLTTFWESAFASWMDRFALDNPAAKEKRSVDDKKSKMLKDLGLEHEAKVLAEMQAMGKSIVRIETKDKDQAAAETLAALKSGADVVYQAYLRDLTLAGYADFLVRVERHSKLGAFSYEVWDSKLAQHVKPYYVIQLCAYAEMLEKIQGHLPHKMAVVLGDGVIEHLDLDQFVHYYRRVKKAFFDFQESFDGSPRPDPEKYRSFGNWDDYAQEILEEADSLTQVAGIRGRHVALLQESGIKTMTALAKAKGREVKGLAAEVLARLQRQSACQIKSKGKDRPIYEVLDHKDYEGERGLYMLPPSTDADVYFDMEGFPLAKDGLEYLWGAVHMVKGEWQFRDFWAHDAASERQALEAFIDWVHGLWLKNPAMHIYHYAKYETSAIRRLMGRYGTREDEVDELLRAGVFVDLYQIVKESLVIGTDSYSIKSVELLYRGVRATEVQDGGSSIVVYNEWLKKQDGETWKQSALLKSIRDYNKDDCDTMVELVDFLRKIQVDAKIEPRDVDFEALQEEASQGTRAHGSVSEIDLASKLEAAAKKNPEGLVLSHLVGFFRREIKPSWWRFFERHRQTEASLVDDIDCIFRLRKSVEDTSGRVYKLAEDREHKIKEEDQFCLHGVTERGEGFHIEEIDWQKGEVTFVEAPELPDPATLVPLVIDFGSRLKPSFKRYTDAWLAGERKKCAAVSFLRRDPPRLKSGKLEDILRKPGDMTAKILDAVRGLDCSHLVIQGPPGSGKTTKAAEIIRALLEDGHRVGVTSNSHEAINHLLRKTVDVIEKHPSRKRYVVAKVRSTPEKDGLDPKKFKKYSGGSDVKYASDNPRLVGGTAYAFASKPAMGKFNYLFVDEAGQVSVAYLIAMALSTENLVLMGDQMQLSQPTQGTHPGESNKSILDYRLRDYATVPDDAGVFLPVSYRMHPSVCQVVSEMIYEKRLASDPQTAKQKVVGGKGVAETGVVYYEVGHEGRTQASEEEVKAIVEMVAGLKKRSFIDHEGRDCGKLTSDDILIVTPYNLQVGMLKEALGESARIGTIDKFQGQEAPVVILSMCASDLESVPRGIDFLLNKNRMNVAISRAKCLAIVVGSQKIASAYVSSVGNMRLVNLYCRIVS